MTDCAILQSCYIPWKGYFDLINSVENFVLYDCAQYTRRDWRNRNRIKTARGLEWLSVPVLAKGNYDAPVDAMQVSEADWAEKHWKAITHNYARAPYFREFSPQFQKCYEEISSELSLSNINARLIKEVCQLLDIRTKITDSRDYQLRDGKTERLLGICLELGADKYLSGPAAKVYLDENMMRNSGVSVRWMSYDNYPEYKQINGPFEHGVSVLDLIFNTGPDARSYMRSFSQSDQLVN